LIAYEAAESFLARTGARGLTLRRALDYIAPTALLAGLALADGGYFPLSRAAAILALFWALAAGLLLRPVSFSLSRCIFSVALVGLAVLTLARGGLAAGVDAAMTDVLYLAAFLALTSFFTSPRPVLVVAATAGIVAAAYGLGTRLLPDRIGVTDAVSAYRLAEPLGYWNALGVMAAMAISVCSVGGARSSRTATMFLTAAATPMLATAMYLTFSRGAWITLGLSIATALAMDARRAQLLPWLAVTTVASAIPVSIAAASSGLTSTEVASGDAIRAGHRLGIVLLASALGAGALAPLAAQLGNRIDRHQAVRRAMTVPVILLAAASVVAAVVALGGPSHALTRAYDGFTSSPPKVDGDLNERLLSFSGTYRVDLWRVAANEAAANQPLGGGPGTFEQRWLEQREIPLKVRDAH